MNNLIYFIEAETLGLIKIGFTTDLNNRLKQIQHNVPFKINLIKSIEGNLILERRLHQLFKPFKDKGTSREWFKIDENPELLKLINSINDENKYNILNISENKSTYKEKLTKLKIDNDKRKYFYKEFFYENFYIRFSERCLGKRGIMVYYPEDFLNIAYKFFKEEGGFTETFCYRLNDYYKEYIKELDETQICPLRHGFKIIIKPGVFEGLNNFLIMIDKILNHKVDDLWALNDKIDLIKENNKIVDWRNFICNDLLNKIKLSEITGQYAGLNYKVRQLDIKFCIPINKTASDKNDA